MEQACVCNDSRRKEREKVEKRIHSLWKKWDKQGGPTEEEKEECLKELRRPPLSKDFVSATDEYTSPEAEAMIGYKYKDMGIMEFLGYE